MRTFVLCLTAFSLLSAADISAPLQSKTARKAAPDFALMNSAGRSVPPVELCGQAASAEPLGHYLRRLYQRDFHPSST